VRIAPARAGVRSYVGVLGGLDVPPALGSRATYLRGPLGGVEGARSARGRAAACPIGAVQRRALTRAIPDYDGEPDDPVRAGPAGRPLHGRGLDALFWRAVRSAAAVGSYGRAPARPADRHTRAATTSSPTGIALGSIQVPGDGQPIVLLVDRQSTGAIQSGHVCSCDIWRVGQARPGQALRFTVGVDEAHRLDSARPTRAGAAVREEIA
jgi:allophanate hydrolase subunit 2